MISETASLSNRAAVLLASGAALIGGANSAGEATAYAQSPDADYVVINPPETSQVLDGKEFTSDAGGLTAIEKEEEFIKLCIRRGRISVGSVQDIRPARINPSKTAVVVQNRTDMSDCDGYVERTFVSTRFETKKPGQRTWRLGAKAIEGAFTNTGRDYYAQRIALGQKRSASQPLQVRTVHETQLRSKVAGYPEFPYNTSLKSTVRGNKTVKLPPLRK